MKERLLAKDLARAMSNASGKVYTIPECQDFLDLFRRTVEDVVLDGSKITLLGFGTFAPKYSKPKTLISGLTGEKFDVAPGMTMKFTVSPTFQKELKAKYLANKEVQNEAGI